MLVIAQIQHWLAPDRSLYQYDSPRTLRSSNEWLLQDNTFNHWLNTGSSLLWVTGKPGCGKTTLSKFIVDSLREDSTTLESPVVVAALFHDYRYALNREQENIRGKLLRALIYQMLEIQPSILLQSCRTDPKACLPYRPEDLNQFRLQQYLRKVVSAATSVGTLVICIDGLDEYEPDIQDYLLECVDLIYKVPNADRKVRIAVASRWLSSIERRYSTARVQLDTKNRRDIADLCDVMLSSRLAPKLFAGHDELHSQSQYSREHGLRSVVDILTEKAEGCFLWANLAIRRLSALDDNLDTACKTCTTNAWQDAVQQIPNGLFPLYEQIANDISVKDRHISWLLLTWISFAVRPLALSEIRAALDYSKESFPSDCNWKEDLLLGRFTDLGFLEVSHSQESGKCTVWFIHHSAREFFRSERFGHVLTDRPTSHTTEALAHGLLARACTSYLKDYCLDSTNAEAPFFDYCVLYWGIHAKSADRSGTSQVHLVDVFQWPSNDRLSTWLEAFNGMYEAKSLPVEKTSLLHVASYYGLASVIEAISKHQLGDLTWNQRDEGDSSILSYSVIHRQEGNRGLLLRRGVLLNSTNGADHTPLSLAARHGHLAVLKLLLHAGADVNRRDQTGASPLHFAAMNGSSEMVKLLIDSGANLDARLPDGHNALTLALLWDREKIAEYIFQKQSRDQIPHWVLGVAIGIATAFGFQKIVRQSLFLLKPNDTYNHYLHQTFITAIVSSSESVVVLLLDLGCDPNTRDHHFGQTGLSIAVASGAEQLVLLLLRRGADPNLGDDRTGNTPLLHAISRGFIRVVELLLCYGAKALLPNSESILVGRSWILSVVSSLIRECPSGNCSGNTGQCSGHSSTESVFGTPNEDIQSPSFSLKAQGRRKRAEDDEDDDRGDGSLAPTPKRIRDMKAKMGCPFQKLYPELYHCGPQDNMARVK